jgi:RNA polymerase sigma-70 factor (ECF subfamily)
MTTAVLESLGYRSMTGPRHSSDLDALLRQVARQDADAFAALYDHTRSRVYGLVARVLRDSGYSEETTQEVYLEVWRTAEAYDSAKGSPLSWLMTGGPSTGCVPSKPPASESHATARPASTDPAMSSPIRRLPPTSAGG